MSYATLTEYKYIKACTQCFSFCTNTPDTICYCLVVLFISFANSQLARQNKSTDGELMSVSSFVHFYTVYVCASISVISRIHIRAEDVSQHNTHQPYRMMMIRLRLWICRTMYNLALHSVSLDQIVCVCIFAFFFLSLFLVVVADTFVVAVVVADVMFCFMHNWCWYTLDTY